MNLNKHLFESVEQIKDVDEEGGLRTKEFLKKVKDEPLISVITVVLNNEIFGRSNRNLKFQKYRNFEHIVIDGGSTDRTLEIIKKMMRTLTIG